MQDLKVGDIVLIRPDESDSYGQEITKLSRSEFYHAAMVSCVDSQLDTVQIIELHADKAEEVTMKVHKK